MFLNIFIAHHNSTAAAEQRLIFAIHANDREFFVSEMDVVASEGSTLNVTEDWGSLLADTLSLRVLQSTEYKMKQSTPAGFDHASHSEPEMLARLRNYKTANQIRNRLREIGLRQHEHALL